MKNKFYRYDDNFKYTIISSIVTILFIFFSIILRRYIEVLIIFILLSLVGFLGVLLNFFMGIHFDYKKNKIIILDTFLIRVINMDEVSYVAINEIKKQRKGKIHWFFSETTYRSFWNFTSKYVYRNGKTFQIKFHKKNKTIEESYYGWLYKAKSKARVENQYNKFNRLIEEFQNYKKDKL